MQFSAAAQVQLVLEYGEVVEGDRMDSCAASSCSSTTSTTRIPAGPAAAPVSVAPSPMRVRRRW